MQNSLKLFGHPQFIYGRNPVEIKTRKGLGLVAYLSIHSGVISRDSIAALLWPESDQTRARNNLRQVLHKLNQIPLGVWIFSRNDLLKIEVPIQGTLDVQDFQILTESILEDHVVATDSLEKLNTLYAGDFLEGFSIPDSAHFEEWLILQREIYRTRNLQALEVLSNQFLEKGLFVQAERAARRAVITDPFRESCWRQLMIAQALNGNSNQALSEYEHYRQFLWDELSIEPEAAMIDLYRSIANGKIKPSPQSVYQVSHVELSPISPVIPHNISTLTTPLIDRVEELEWITDFLTDPANRLITITGEGGIGKTRLALEVTSRLIESGNNFGFSDGVYYVPLAPLTNPNYIVSTIAKQISFLLPGASTENSIQALCNHLSTKKMFLVLDNFEHLLMGVDIVMEILYVSPGIKILVTSREPLRLRGEQILSLEGLSVNEDQASHTLFMYSARRIQPGFNLSEEDKPALGSILRLTQGIPLAIEIAATWVESLPLRTIADEIEHGLDLLETDIRDLPARHRSMRAVFDASWRGLDEEDKRVLAILSCLEGEFTRLAAINIASTGLRVLSRLVGRSLLQYNLREDRYQMHELMRMYAGEKLAKDKNLDIEARYRHSTFFSDLLKSMKSSLQSGWEEQALQDIDKDIDNIRSVWHRAIQSCNATLLGNSAFMLHHYYLRRNLFEEGEAIFRSALDQSLNEPDESDLLVRARLLNFSAEFLWHMGKNSDAKKHVQQAFTTLNNLQVSDVETNWDRAFSLYMMGQIQPELDEKIRLHRKSLDIFAAIPDTRRQATELSILGKTMHNGGRYSEAESYTRESLEIFKSLSNSYPIASTMGILGYQMLLLGKLKQAEDYFDKSLMIARQCKATDLIVIHMNWLSQTYLLKGNFNKAAALIQESLVEARQSGFVHFIIHSTNIFGLVNLLSGRYAEARSLYNTALDLVLKTGRSDYEGLSKMFLAAAASAQEDHLFALSQIDDSVHIFRRLNRPDALGEALVIAGLIDIHAGKFEQARLLLREAWEILRDLRQYHIYLMGLSTTALFFAQTGDEIKAIEIYALASKQPLVAVSFWHKHMIGNHIQSISRDLSEEVVTDAATQGRAYPFWEIPAKLLGWLG